MQDLPLWKSVARHMPIERRSRASSQASLYVNRSTSNEIEDFPISGYDSWLYGIPKEVKPLPAAPQTSSEQRLSTGILNLPRELRDQLISYLTPSSAVALKLTCRTLYHSGLALPVLFYLSRKTAESRHEWSLMQERMGRLHGELTCSGCQKIHSTNFFLKEEREKEATHRLCIGRRMILELTPYTSVTFAEFEKDCRRLLCDTRSNAHEFGWFVYHMSGRLIQVPRHFPVDFFLYPLQGHYEWMKDTEGPISLLTKFTLRMDSVDPKAQSCASIYLGLQKLPFMLCRHFTSTTKELAKLIHKAQRRRLREVREERCIEIRCYYCNCIITLEVNNGSKTLLIRARRLVGDGSPTALDWCEQAEHKLPGNFEKRAPAKVRRCLRYIH